MSESVSAASHDAPLSEELKRALKAFKKRLKLTRLDYESKLGYGPMTKGGDAAITAIPPPNQFPESVWKELVQLGKLKYVGQGLYELGHGV